MKSEDADDFLAQLEIRGVRIDGETPEAVIVNSSRPDETKCVWLTLLDYQGHLFGRHRDDDSTTLVAPGGWDPDKPPSIVQYSPEEVAEKLEFLRRENNVEVYRHKETGQEVYVGRTTESYDEIYASALETIRKYLRNPGAPPVAEESHAEIREAITKLQRVVAAHPDFWAGFLFLGKGWHALDDHERAYKNFRKAYEIDSANTTVCKELAGSCIELGRIEEGVQVGEHAVSVEPDNPELICNLAVNYLFAKKGEAAEKAIKRAIELDKDDPVNQAVSKLVKSIVSGARPWPKTFADLQGH